jgi:spermidine/putrescine transport system substrate-binding protein
MSSKKIFFWLVTISLFISCTSKNDQAASRNHEKKTVSLFIWSNYVSEEIIKEFEAKYNLKVVVSNYSSNEELLSKLQAGATGYDVVVPSDYMVAIMAKLNLLIPLKKELITNLAGVDGKFLGLAFDPKNEYSMPYGWATTGIAINTKFFKGPMKSWKQLFEEPSLRGKVNLLDDNREVFGAALKSLGFSLNSKNRAEVTQAINYLKRHKSQFKSFSSEPVEAITNGEVWASQMYSSDALQVAAKTNGLVKYIIPQEGCTLALDNLAIPVGAKNTEGANLLINFLISEKSNETFVKKIYSGPILQSTKAKLPKDMQENSGLFPDANLSSSFEMLLDLELATGFYDQLWTELKSE